MKQPAAALYVRVSTDDQTVDNQLIALTRWLNERGLGIAAVYQESESAFKSGHQTELARLRADSRRRGRPWDIVAVWALDRLTREGPTRALSLIADFRSVGVRVLSYQEQWLDMPGGLDEVFTALIAWVANWESKRRSERTKAGLARLAAGGKTLGRPKGSTDTKKRKKRRYYEPVKSI
ncbi:Site-specific DNA recombinase [Dehalogenimonas formicexedens]|uniref:Site-specific DNA recombinase n=1 Tax=Dehalogenimonas formicexedens TaxID=1839801 RepID=A0A1P8F6U9_9CHLR|nr:recombinase family protein [Dehalogenimonas formicexedens]APV44204.1 Site-specific DNA recombinase [Dehalogenimonas formicexedens]